MTSKQNIEVSSYLFGQIDTCGVLNERSISKITQAARQKSKSFLALEMTKIISALDRVGKLWTKNSNYYNQALELLSEEISFSRPMIEATLDLVPSLCDSKNLKTKLTTELGSFEILDRFVSRPGFDGRVKAIPHGVLLHVSAGNVFLGCIDSLVNGFLTKNISILKLSSRN